MRFCCVLTNYKSATFRFTKIILARCDGNLDLQLKEYHPINTRSQKNDLASDSCPFSALLCAEAELVRCSLRFVRIKIPKCNIVG